VTLRTRIALVAGAAVAICVVAVGAVDYVATRSSLRGQVDSYLDSRAKQVTAPSGPDGGPQNGQPDTGPPGFHTLPVALFGESTGVTQIVHQDGDVTKAQGQQITLPVSARTLAVARTGTGRFYSDTTVKGQHLRILTVGAGEFGAVQVARSLTEVDTALSRLVTLLVVVGGFGILVAAALGWLVASTALAPITRFTRRTEQVTADRDVAHRLDATRSDELGRLAASFNQTLDTLERSVDAQRHLVADASHELRTPIASLRANIQVLDDADRLPAADRAALRADIVGELDELTALVADIVELARNGEPASQEDEVRVDEVTAVLVERFARRFPDTVSFDATLEPTLVRGDPSRIGRAVQNLLDNARKWSPPGGTVTVTLSGGMVTVRDQGPGFDAADLPHVFDRFYRASAARGQSGSGLGLAIARQAAETHHGAVSAANAAGGGAVVTISFGPVIEHATPSDPDSEPSASLRPVAGRGPRPLTGVSYTPLRFR
jgi:two-component system, OmpR family, sensor histidine kinase MprB